jgi:hypothetical protein
MVDGLFHQPATGETLCTFDELSGAQVGAALAIAGRARWLSAAAAILEEEKPAGPNHDA